MQRLIKEDVNNMDMIELSLNQVFIKDDEAWYRDYDREVSIRNLAREMFARNGVDYPVNNEEFDEFMFDLLQDGYESLEGMIAILYRSLWAFAEVRAKLKKYEDMQEKLEKRIYNIKSSTDYPRNYTGQMVEDLEWVLNQLN